MGKLGDWNSRIGALANIVLEGEDDEVRIVEERSSADKTVSNQEIRVCEHSMQQV